MSGDVKIDLTGLELQPSADGVSFAVKVVPRARKDEIAGVEGTALKVRLNAPPVEGKANQALVRFLVARCGVTQADVEIVRGSTSRHKLVRVRGLTAGELKRRIGA